MDLGDLLMDGNHLRCCMDRASTDITAVCSFQDAANAKQV